MKEIRYTLTQEAKRVGGTVYLGNTKIEADIKEITRNE